MRFTCDGGDSEWFSLSDSAEILHSAFQILHNTSNVKYLLMGEKKKKPLTARINYNHHEEKPANAFMLLPLCVIRLLFMFVFAEQI